MDTLTLLTALADAGASLSQHQDAGAPTVRVHLASARWPASMRGQIPLHKETLLRLLTLVEPGTLVTAERLLGWHEFFEEGAAIMEYDGGLPRAEAEEAAWMRLVTLVRGLAARRDA